MTDLILGSENDTYCSLCRYGHGNIVCDCGKPHEEHTFALGWFEVVNGVIVRECTGYSQKHLRQRGETQDAFNRRLLGKII